jgi:hypothetical protein
MIRVAIPTQIDLPGQPSPVCRCGRIGASFYTPSAKAWLCTICYQATPEGKRAQPSLL